MNELLGATDRRTTENTAHLPKKLPEAGYSTPARRKLDPMAGQIAASVLPKILPAQAKGAGRSYAMERCWSRATLPMDPRRSEEITLLRAPLQNALGRLTPELRRAAKRLRLERIVMAQCIRGLGARARERIRPLGRSRSSRLSCSGASWGTTLRGGTLRRTIRLRPRSREDSSAYRE